jgi:hypothetical protein
MYKRRFIFDWNLLIVFISFKIIVIFSIIFFFTYYDSSHDINLWNRWYSGKSVLDLIYLPFSNWDGQHYLLLADKGYGFWQPSHAFFPLFPKAITFLSFFVGNFYLSAFIANLLFSYLFLVFYYNYAKEFCDRDNALKSVVFLLSYPSAFYLTVFYSEALFLFLLFAFLYFYKKKSYWSMVFLAFMPLARGQTLFIFVALVAVFLQQILKKKTVDYPYELFNLIGMVCGFLLYFAFMYVATGSPFSGLEAQKIFSFNCDLWNCINPLHFLTYMFSSTHNGLFSYTNSVIDKVFIIFLLGSIPIIIKSKDPVTICFFIALAYFPASMGLGGSYIRHSLSAIPFLSIVIFSVFPEKKVLFLSVSLACFILQIFLLIGFSLNYWVA